MFARLATFIFRDSFWMAQVAQINITPERRFEIIPVVGNQVITFGKGDEIEGKFNRLFAFYQQVLKKTGFEKYKMIDVQYHGQVVASTRSGVNKVDSIQLRKNIEKLVAEAQQTDNIIDKSQQ